MGYVVDLGKLITTALGTFIYLNKSKEGAKGQRGVLITVEIRASEGAGCCDMLCLERSHHTGEAWQKVIYIATTIARLGHRAPCDPAQPNIDHTQKGLPLVIWCVM